MKKICCVLTISETVRAFFIPQLKYLAENGFDVTVVCSYDKNLQNELGDKVKYHPIDIPRGLSVFGSISAIRQLYKFFKKEKFDMVQYSTPNSAFYSSSVFSSSAFLAIVVFHACKASATAITA